MLNMALDTGLYDESDVNAAQTRYMVKKARCVLKCITLQGKNKIFKGVENTMNDLRGSYLIEKEIDFANDSYHANKSKSSNF